jgi:hypothetical protein
MRFCLDDHQLDRDEMAERCVGRECTRDYTGPESASTSRMADYYRQYRLFQAVIVLGLFMLWSFYSMPVMDFLMGLSFFRASPQEAAEWLAASSKGVRYECRDGEGGWDYICDEYHTDHKGVLRRQRIGVIQRYSTGRRSILPAEGPVPSRHAHDQQIEQLLREEKEFQARVNLNFARIDQLTKLPGIDEPLAYRIATAAMDRKFDQLEDVLKVEGMDRQKLERIRPLVRVEKYSSLAEKRMREGSGKP